MKHQWSQPADTWVCDACGLTVPFLSILVRADVDANVLVDLGGVVTGQCPAAPQMMLSEELSTEVLTRITEDLWVNPSHIVAAYRNGAMTSLASVSGATEVIDRPLEEVVALLNGEA